MELNFKDKFTHIFEDTSGEKYLEKKSQNPPGVDKKVKLFHIDCKYTRKKICSCKFFDGSRNICPIGEQEFSNFLVDLINDDLELEVRSDKKISFIKKDFETSKLLEKREMMSTERLKNMEFSKIKYFMKNTDESKLLSIHDYKEIEKSINDDKKICENCKMNIYENNYHKGWRNEAGENVLLCSMCSKKYFNGALEIKFDSFSKREEMIPINRNVAQSSQIVIKNTYNTTPTKINFQVTNTSRPVEDSMLSNKRSPESCFDLVCSNRRCNKVGKKNEFLCCSKCEKYYHPGCVDPPLVMKFVNRFKWLCSNCKSCQVCYENKEDKLNRCATCDRTFHQTCQTTVVSSMNNKTYCTDCIHCKNCSKTLSLLTLLNQNDFISVKGFRVCQECWKYYKNKHYCPKCLKIYKQENEGQNLKIYCNKCLNWYHAECEGVSAEEMKEKNKGKYNYSCSFCKMS